MSGRVVRVGRAAVKGTRHESLPAAGIGSAGVLGDRALAFCDPERGRVLRTVENPGLVAVRARWDDPVLELDLPGGRRVRDELVETGELVADYWGRAARLQTVGSAHAAAVGALLDRPVVLARAEPGAIVYSGAVTLVTTSALAELSGRIGGPVADERFRANLTVDDAAGPELEALPAGARLAVGSAELIIRGPVPRCAVIDIGERGRPEGALMRALAGYRRRGPEVYFGLDCAVARPGRVAVGDAVRVREPLVGKASRFHFG
ncbi:hypothetical protein GGQ54_002154 [Naumannella cuiyingiana]|uniref:MOSC domain-containing protein n=1 Tax=Naumannella cuiyingiana TaxID=1347891 RepID=A0A7Z0D9R9_9ACTN|nr:MOSC domain-containing protein [Naumannella cuiyingiana]NYI71594.1 hypothetical protein [Naumannella cuiyingiana]